MSCPKYWCPHLSTLPHVLNFGEAQTSHMRGCSQLNHKSCWASCRADRVHQSGVGKTCKFFHQNFVACPYRDLVQSTSSLQPLTLNATNNQAFMPILLYRISDILSKPKFQLFARIKVKFLNLAIATRTQCAADCYARHSSRAFSFCLGAQLRDFYSVKKK